MQRVHKSLAGLLVLLPLVFATPGAAQAPDSVRSGSPHLQPLPTVGSGWEDRLRVAQLLGREPADGYLIRSPSALAPPLPGAGDQLRWAVIPPEILLVRNSDLPFSLNDGAIWAGRGWSTRVRAGFRAEYGRIRLLLAPELVRSENRAFQTIPAEVPDRSAFVPPWYTGSETVDLPLRFGDEPLTVVTLGQSTLTLDAGPLVVGASSENQWWGPGLRNAIVMSNNAPGIPHLFLRTSSPVETRVGAFEAKWMVGGLTESLFFDTTSANDIRSISAFAGTFRPAAEPDLTLGLARVVYAAAGSTADVPGRALDVFTQWDQPPAEADDPGDTGPEQILSLFGRWIFPAAGLELYTEWARLQLPRSVRDILAAPNHTQGYTVGLQWARPLGDSAQVLRLQSELTYLEQSATFRQRPVPSYYVSRSVPQGYTQRGQVIGAAIGPGASSQWLAADYFAPRWQLGVFAGRIRWENDAYYRQYSGKSFLAHDVSLLGGVRGGYRFPGFEIAAEVTRATRYNYLFQNPLTGFGDPGTDIRNTTLQFAVTPLFGARGR